MTELDDETRDRLLDLWRDLGSPQPPELPAHLLAERGISPEEYAAWRMDVADAIDEARRALAQAFADDDQLAAMRERGEAPPDLLTVAERDAAERARLELELRQRRLAELEGQASWEPDEDDAGG